MGRHSSSQTLSGSKIRLRWERCSNLVMRENAFGINASCQQRWMGSQASFKCPGRATWPWAEED